jgi:hypothetical protein
MPSTRQACAGAGATTAGITTTLTRTARGAAMDSRGAAPMSRKAARTSLGEAPGLTFKTSHGAVGSVHTIAGKTEQDNVHTRAGHVITCNT